MKSTSVVVTPAQLCLVLSYCGRGSLEGIMQAEGTCGTWEDLRRGLAVDVVRGLKFLHHDLSPALIHWDVKPANILVSSGRYKLISIAG